MLGHAAGTQLPPSPQALSLASIPREAGPQNLHIISSFPHYCCFRGKTYHIWLIDKHHHFETSELTLVKNDLHGAFNTMAHPPPPLGCDRELWKEIPLERNPVHHDLGGKRVTLPHDYAIHLINIHKHFSNPPYRIYWASSSLRSTWLQSLFALVNQLVFKLCLSVEASHLRRQGITAAVHVFQLSRLHFVNHM